MKIPLVMIKVIPDIDPSQQLTCPGNLFSIFDSHE